MTYKYGDVVLVKFPFSNFQYSKPRPGVVISSPRYNHLRKDVILLAITSQLQQNNYAEFVIRNLKSAGLLKASILKPSIYTMEQQLVYKCLGRLSNKDRKTLNHCIRTIIGNDSH